jgi:quinoprotein glucose dehydrogenase
MSVGSFLARMRVPLLVLIGFLAGMLVVMLVVILGDTETSGDAEAENASGRATASAGPFLTPAPTRQPPARDPPYSYTGLPPGVRLEHIVDGIEGPTALDGTRDGRLFIAEQFSGAVRVAFGGVLLDEPFFVVPDLHTEAEPGFVTELGLVGLILEPREPGREQSMLIYYSAENAEVGRLTKLVRIRDDGDGNGVLEDTLLEIPITPTCCHIGGSLAWMPDGTLLVGVGDHDANEQAQDLGSVAGKILRITRTGAPALGNPFLNTPGADPRVYAYGLRNPFGIAVDPEGPTYIVENGYIGFDTVHELRAGANYGWDPSLLRGDEDIETPLVTYYESLGLAGAAVYRGEIEEFDGDLFYCQFHRGGALHWYPITDDPFEYDRIVSGGCSSNLRVLPDGGIYMLDYFTGSVLRIARR